MVFQSLDKAAFIQSRQTRVSAGNDSHTVPVEGPWFLEQLQGGKGGELHQVIDISQTLEMAERKRQLPVTLIARFLNMARHAMLLMETMISRCPILANQEIVDYFYYSLLRTQGEDTTVERSSADNIPLSEVPNIMRALGYYPTEQVK